MLAVVDAAHFDGSSGWPPMGELNTVLALRNFGLI